MAEKFELTDNEKLWADLNTATTRFLEESRQQGMTDARLSMEDFFRAMTYGVKQMLYNGKLANPYTTRDVAAEVSRLADFAHRDAEREIANNAPDRIVTPKKLEPRPLNDRDQHGNYVPYHERKPY